MTVTIDLDSLPEAYRTKQTTRILVTRQRIADTESASAEGRTIPDNNALVIGTGRRLNAAVLFLDICRFSTRPSESAQEQEMLLRIINFFFSEMIRIIEDYGGFVEKNTGDGLMAYFSSSATGRTEVCKQALAASMTMFHAAKLLINPIIRNTPGAEELNFRICIDYGPITIARVGAAQRFNNIVAIGSTANRTSKMLSFAGDDMILLGDFALERLPRDWVAAFAKLQSAETGWVHRADGRPYCFWQYVGRWV